VDQEKQAYEEKIALLSQKVRGVKRG